MSVIRHQSIRCTCGAQLTAPVAQTVNAARSPHMREAIMRGDFHRVQCTDCKQTMTVETSFIYADLTDNLLMLVLPHGTGHRWKSASRELSALSGMIPAQVAPGDTRVLRVVFGLAELREKLLARDHDIDDRALELLKVQLVHEHPVLIGRPRINIHLQAREEHDDVFAATYDHHPRHYRVRVPRKFADGFLRDTDKLHAWSREAHNTPIFALDDHWVSMMRWSPGPAALAALHDYAARIGQGERIDTGEPAFRAMLAGLPRGEHLAADAKREIRALYNYVRAHPDPDLEKEIFQIRFGKTLDTDWIRNDVLDDVDQLWDLLEALPDSDVEGNTSLEELDLDDYNGGVYYPRDKRIVIGFQELTGNPRDYFPTLLRHEVGHAVQEQLDTNKNKLIAEWLRNRFGWRTFDEGDQGIDAWIDLMGGWETISQTGKDEISPTNKGEIRTALRAALGPSFQQWGPTGILVLPANHPWNYERCGPRIALERSGTYWYHFYNCWHWDNTRAYFVNFYYRSFMAVDLATLKIIDNMPRDYAAMSEQEFFAELYALYHDVQNANRAAIPPDVLSWMETNLGPP